MVRKNLQDNIAIGMNDKYVYVISIKTTEDRDLFAPGPNCFAYSVRMLKETVSYGPPYSVIKVCEYLQCPSEKIEGKTTIILLNCTIDGRLCIAMHVAKIISGRQ